MSIRSHLLLLVLMAALFGISLGSFQRYRAVIRNQADRQLAQAEIAQARVSIASNSLNTFITACDYYLADEAYTSSNPRQGRMRRPSYPLSSCMMIASPRLNRRRSSRCRGNSSA